MNVWFGQGLRQNATHVYQPHRSTTRATHPPLTHHLHASCEVQFRHVHMRSVCPQLSHDGLRVYSVESALGSERCMLCNKQSVV